MDTTNAADLSANESELKVEKKGKLFKFLNFVTLGAWGKLTPRERAVAFTSWNISSWVTVGQVSGGAWAWSKVSPWLVPLAKTIWTKLVWAFLALKWAVKETPL